jgi:hypothetical protein
MGHDDNRPSFVAQTFASGEKVDNRYRVAVGYQQRNRIDYYQPEFERLT